MDIGEGSEKKLKRGLHDLSPLFQGSQAVSVSETTVPAVLHPAFGVEFIAVCVPERSGDSYLANAYVASQLALRAEIRIPLVSILPGFNTLPAKRGEAFPSIELLSSQIFRLRLSHQELWSMSQNGTTRNGLHTKTASTLEKGSYAVFFDFEPTQFRSLARIALLLDRLILFVEPQAESLQEAYRLLKVFWNYNREIEFLLLFRGQSVGHGLDEFLFERFSLIASRFLGVSMGWLGDLNDTGKGIERYLSDGSAASRFNPEPLMMGEGLSRPLSPEKNRFWQGLQKILERRMPP